MLIDASSFDLFASIFSAADFLDNFGHGGGFSIGQDDWDGRMAQPDAMVG